MSKQLTLAERVYPCYEAGPFGYGLHRELTALGVTNYVVRPRDWDEYSKNVKTDRRDARRLAVELDRYVAGNHDAFCVVRVPTPAEEQARSVSRARQSLQEEKQRLAAKGRSTALYYGHRLVGEWFAPGPWKDLAPTLPPLVQQLLTSLQRRIAAVERELAVLTQQVEAPAPMDLPVGMGRLTSQILEREICDWQRFENRRQVGSYTGMCPREDTSADRRLPRADQQARLPAGAGRTRGTVLATDALPAALSAGGQVASRAATSQNHPGQAQADRGGPSGISCGTTSPSLNGKRLKVFWSQ